MDRNRNQGDDNERVYTAERDILISSRWLKFALSLADGRLNETVEPYLVKTLVMLFIVLVT